MALQCTITYYGDKQDASGMPDPFFHYFVVASPGINADSGLVSIMSLTEARAKGVAQGPSNIFIAKEGGLEAAIKIAEEFLDKAHPGLKKIVSDQKAR